MENTKKSQFTELALVFLGTLGTIKILYEFRSGSFIGHYLSTITAFLLIYPCVLTVSLRKRPLIFFEKNLHSVLFSLKTFFLTALVIFPPFLFLNHIYQHIVFKWPLMLSPYLHIPPAFWELLLIQTLLVGLPEEFFFRGYVQTTLHPFLSQKIGCLKKIQIDASWAIPASAFIFAFSHSFITFRWWHFSIFFPALVFGWLREKTNGLIAPILFHALSNLLMNLIQMAYR